MINICVTHIFLYWTGNERAAMQWSWTCLSLLYLHFDSQEKWDRSCPLNIVYHDIFVQKSHFHTDTGSAQINNWNVTFPGFRFLRFRCDRCKYTDFCEMRLWNCEHILRRHESTVHSEDSFSVVCVSECFFFFLLIKLEPQCLTHALISASCSEMRKLADSWSWRWARSAPLLHETIVLFLPFGVLSWGFVFLHEETSRLHTWPQPWRFSRWDVYLLPDCFC